MRRPLTEDEACAAAAALWLVLRDEEVQRRFVGLGPAGGGGKDALEQVRTAYNALVGYPGR